MTHSTFPVHGGSKVIAFAAAILLTACAQPSQPEMTSTIEQVDMPHAQGDGSLPGGADAIALLSLFVSIAAALYARNSVKVTTLVAHMSSIVQVESRLGEFPSALRFHGISLEDLKQADIDHRELAYLLNSFTLGSIRHNILSRWARSAFPPKSYRYQMCLTQETRRAWPLVKKLMNPSSFVDRIDRTIEKIEKQEAHTLRRPQE